MDDPLPVLLLEAQPGKYSGIVNRILLLLPGDNIRGLTIPSQSSRCQKADQVFHRHLLQLLSKNGLGQHADGGVSGRPDPRLETAVIPVQAEISGNQTEQGGLTGPVGAHQGNLFFSFYLKINMVKDDLPSKRDGSLTDLI